MASKELTTNAYRRQWTSQSGNGPSDQARWRGWRPDVAAKHRAYARHRDRGFGESWPKLTSVWPADWRHASLGGARSWTT